MERLDWLKHIKEIRATTGVGILDAEEVAVRDLKWRRWVEMRINNDPECAKSARSHMRLNADRSLIVEEAGRLVVRLTK